MFLPPCATLRTRLVWFNLKCQNLKRSKTLSRRETMFLRVCVPQASRMAAGVRVDLYVTSVPHSDGLVIWKVQLWKHS